MARTRTFNETEVIDKAIRLFTAKGYNGTSAQDIVDTLAISRSSLYNTFGDKQGLFMKALDQYYNWSFGQIIQRLKKSTDFAATMEEIFNRVVNQSLETGFENGCLMVNSASEMSAHNSDVAAFIRKSMRRVEDALFKAIDKAQKMELINNKYSARALASFLFNTLVGLRIMAKAGAEKESFKNIVRLSLSLLVKDSD
jgi:TetR/AcrR family transcriptional repressor of nem operon